MGRTFDFFKDWDNCNAIYWKYSSMDSARQIVYGASTNTPCYIDGSAVQVVNGSNIEVLSTVQLYIDGDLTIVAGITTNDKFTVGSRDRPVQQVRPLYDETGNLDYVVVYL